MPVTAEDLLPPSSSSSSLKSSPLPPRPATGTSASAASPLPARPSEKPSVAPRQAIIADDLVAPAKPVGGFDLGQAAVSPVRAFAKGWAETAAAAGTAFEWGASVLDAASAALGGKTPQQKARLGEKTYAQTAHDLWVRPWVERAHELEPTLGDNQTQNIMNTVGSVVGDVATVLNQAAMMPQMAAEELITPVWEAASKVAVHGMKSMSMPAFTAAVNTTREVYNATGDKSKAIAAGLNVFTNTSLMGAAPIAKQGGALVRATSGAAIGAGIGEASRVSANQVLPGSMQQGFTWSGLAQEALLGAGLGVIVGKNPREAVDILNEKRKSDPGSIDELIVRSPETAQGLADHVEAVDPATARYIKNRINRYTKASDKDLEAIGKKRVEAELAPKGTFDYATGRAKVDLTEGLGKPAKEAKGKIDTAKLLDEFAGKPAEKPPEAPPPEAPEPDVFTGQVDLSGIPTPELRREDLPNRVLYYREKTAFWSKYSQREQLKKKLPYGADIGVSRRLPPGLQEAHEEALPIFAPVAEQMKTNNYDNTPNHPITSEKVSAGKFLQDMADVSSDPGVKALYSRLAPFLNKTKIAFVHPDNPIMDKANGKYDPKTKRLLIALDPNSGVSDPKLSATIVHEAVHGAVYDFMRMNPKHPLTKEIRSLMAEAKVRGRRMGVLYAGRLGDSSIASTKAEFIALQHIYNTLYGMVNPHEFVAEVFSNPTFQRFLVLSERYASKGWKGRQLVRDFGKVIRKILKLPEGYTADLLDSVLDAAEETMHVWKNALETATKPKPTQAPPAEAPIDLIEERRKRRMKSREVLTQKNPIGDQKAFEQAITRGEIEAAISGLETSPEAIAKSETDKAWRRSYDEENLKKLWDKRTPEEQQAVLDWIKAHREQAPSGPKEQLSVFSNGISSSVESMEPPPTIYKAGVSRESIANLFTSAHDIAKKIPGWKIAEGKIKEYVRYFVRNFVPEALSDKAELAGADVTAAIAKRKARDAAYEVPSRERRKFWNQNAKDQWTFIKGYEKGEKFSNDAYNKIADFYRKWMKDIFLDDNQAGIEYEERDNYMTHIFDDGPGVAEALTRRYGAKWGDPYFMKDRMAESYEYLMNLKNDDGTPKFKPRFTNPEEIMVARQYASNIAHMRIEMLADLEKHGLAKRIEKGKPAPEGFSPDPRRSPNGTLYWIHQDAQEILHNAFDTKSMWTLKGPVGDFYRGLMAVKNYTVAIRLFGLFHPVHLGLVTNNAAALTRAFKNVFTGNIDPKYWLADVARGLLPLSGVWTYRSTASRMLKAYWGELGKDKLSSGEQQMLMYMAEGGLVPGMSAQDRITAGRAFMDAWHRGEKTAIFRLPFAVISNLQKPMFHIWIPQLKIMAYTRDVATAFRVNPELVSDPVKRRLALRQIAKSVDNRFGEMSYDTMFWNRTVKDIAVLNTLSVGWQMGLIREFGGGAVQIGKFPLKEGTLAARLKEGELDKALYSTFYIGLSALYGATLMYAFTGKWPTSMLDYFAPQSGGENPDGTPKRITTPMFTREIVSIKKHMENEGVAGGFSHLVQNKASGVIGLVGSTWTGVDGLGREIRDPNAPAFKQLEQNLAYIFKDIQPISASATEKAGEPITSVRGALSVAGFQPAPKYLMETPMVGDIKSTFQKYNDRLTPYDQAAMSSDRTKLKRAYDNNSPEYDNLLDKMEKKYDLAPEEVAKLEKGLRSDADPTVRMFSRLPWKEQKRILDKHWYDMTPDQQDDFLSHSNKAHLRYDYEPPAEKQK